MRRFLVSACIGLAGFAAQKSALSDEIVCLIEPSVEVNVGTPVDGVLEVVNVDRGDLVEAGQLLARLNTGVEAAAVDFQSAKSQFGARKVSRNKELNAKRLVSDHEIDEMTTEQKLAELELKQRQEVLSLRTIVSPISGIVVDRFRNAGDLVKQERIFRIVQIDPLFVEVIAPANYFGRIRMNQSLNVKPQLSNQWLSARVRNIDKVIDSASGTFRIRLSLPNPNYAVPSGQRCAIRF
jgi:membrane fusion protein, multidrug efflux system